MLLLIMIWAALLLALVIFAIGHGKGGALALAYFLGLSLIHVPGVLSLFGSGIGLASRNETQVGFETTVAGMAAFVVGCVLARAREASLRAGSGLLPSPPAAVIRALGRRALALGVIVYFLLLPVSGRVPSLTGIVSASATMLILGFWSILYGATEEANGRTIFTTFALLPLLPLATLVTGGFLGYGIYWVLSIVAFQFAIARRRIWFCLAAMPLAFLGLSLFVTYMGQRNGIREVVWHEQAGLVDRLVRVSSIITEFELLDLDSRAHITAIDGRLNQNWLVGAAVARHDAGSFEFAYGSTAPLWALIPRAVWPDKPAIGGGGDIVSTFTGIRFATGTSVGAGQVLEFYINFGVEGMLICFLGLGYLLLRLDQGIMRALAAGDLRGFLLRGMPGLMLLQPGGNLLEILVGAIAAVAAALLILQLGLLDIRTAPDVRSATGTPR